MAIKNLRSLLDFHNEDWSNLLADLLDRNSRINEPKNIYSKEDTENVAESHDQSQSRPASKDVIQDDINYKNTVKS